MKINLKDLEIVYINLETYVNRNQTMLNMFNSIGLEASRVEGVAPETQPGYDVIADSHLKALNSSWAERILILEDDCVPHNYRNEIEVPDDADVVYLGVHCLKHYKQRVSPEVWRISGMVGAHAILYITQRGKDFLAEAVQLTKDEKFGFDVSLGTLQHKVNTYALNSPSWYQKDIPELTKFNLDDSDIVSDYYGGAYPDYETPLQFDTGVGEK
jgi:hypothetical protein